jgi:hypothetical protein
MDWTFQYRALEWINQSIKTGMTVQSKNRVVLIAAAPSGSDVLTDR